MASNHCSENDSSSNQTDLYNNDLDQISIHNNGLTTKEALLRLHRDMAFEVERMKNEFSKRKFFSWLIESISFKSELSKMRWPSVLFMAGHAIAHFIVAFILEVDNLATNWIGFQGFILSTLLIFNLVVNLWDTELRFKELLMKSEELLALIKKCSQDKYLLKKWKRYNWSSAHAKTLFIPKSPCVNQTLTYRDESCLNLPDYLLVRGDIIHLYPGERAPADCISLKSTNQSRLNQSDIILLQEGQVFCGTIPHRDETEGFSNASLLSPDFNIDMNSDSHKDGKIRFGHAKLKKANSGVDFLVKSTPYIQSLRISLQRSHKRPVNSVEKECFIISRKYFETFVIPSVFLMSTIVTAIHYGYLDLTDSDQKIKTISIAYLLLRPSLTIMPFLPWMFPCIWLIVNAYGSARILCFGDAQRAKLKEEVVAGDNPNYSPGLAFRGATNTAAAMTKFENLLATPTAAGSSENKHDEDDLHDIKSNIKFTSIFSVFVDLIRGKSGHVWRSSSLLQVLGCLTSLCCIDKVGILSYANPTPEKVFILTKNENDDSKYHTETRNHSSDAGFRNQPESDEHLVESNNHEGFSTISNIDQAPNNRVSVQIKSSATSHSRLEVLDVSPILTNYRRFNVDSIISMQQSSLQFDDLNWRKYIDNLKPLGLVIMMNNCFEESFGDYFRFYKHISYESVLRCNLTPVVKRRCLCGLSKLIGFSKDAIDNYKYVNQIGVYKLIDPKTIKKAKLVTSLENTTRLKLPFPNMICNILQDITTGGYQVFSQGTADIILDACVEFWDGKKLTPLDESTRRKIMDFYHRTSLTSYCSAFSYTPLIKGHKLENKYIELPPENSKFAPPLRKLANEHQDEFLRNQLVHLPNRFIENNETFYGSHLSSQDNINFDNTNLVINESSIYKQFNHQITRRHLSLEDVQGQNEAEYFPSRSDRTKGSKRSHGLDEILDELTDQVFVGMVSMQYQACPDFVALVEQLEHACIRFVHFSKENELRSRVFSEKMGLESGWNCHISLQSDEDLDVVDKNDNSNYTSSHKDEHQDELSKTTSFSPTKRVLDILRGSRKDKTTLKSNRKADTEDSTSYDESISSDEHTLYSWKSLPSLLMHLSTKIPSDIHHLPTPDHNSTNKVDQSNYTWGFSNDNTAPASDYGDDLEHESEVERTDGSLKDGGFESLAFDMSNRAKLPKGIENIKPHLETVDNVPLQVSLFTDCTPNLTQEMIEIMQEYGEIVCVIGSSSSKLNTPIFLQANASIAIEPMVPQSCTRNDGRLQRSLDRKRRKRLGHEKRRNKKSQVIDEETECTAINMKPRPNNPRDRLGIGPTDPSKVMRAKPPQPSSSSSSSSQSSSSSSSCSSSPPNSDFDDNLISDDDQLDANNKESSNLIRQLPGPSSLASKLASLPCSYSYDRKEQVNLYGLIMEARHFTFKMKNTFVCMICFALSISSAEFLASILFLPPMLSSGLTIWLTVVVVPLQSFSLMSTTMDSQVMKIAVGKNLQLKPENITFFVVCYLIKFIPSIIVVVLSFGLIIAHSCKLTGFGSSSLGPCWMFTYVQHGNSTSSDTGDEDLLWSTHLLTAQVSAAFLLVLYFVVISAGFVHRSHLMWQRTPTSNHFWVIISLTLIIGQLLCNQLVLQVNLGSSKIPYEFLASLPIHIWVISFAWPILVIGVNLLVKRAEIKATIRQQRRARFDFNTKLGMNSPF